MGVPNCTTRGCGSREEYTREPGTFKRIVRRIDLTGADDGMPGVMIADKDRFFSFTKGRILTLDY